MSAVQTIGNTKDSRQFLDNCLVLRTEAGKFIMFEFGGALPVIARNLGDDLDFMIGKAG
jgi:hypothetical protein